MQRSRVLSHLTLVLLAAVFSAAFTYGYVSSERTIHHWDEAAYHDMTLAKAVYVRELPPNLPDAIGRLAHSIWVSLGRDYSDLHTLPLLPVALAFGPSRAAYVLSTTLIYLFPLALVMGAVSANVFRGPSASAFWLGAFLALVTPGFWVPTLAGYPDVGALLLVMIAVLTFLLDTGLRNSWRILAIALSLTLAVLTRRHFAYLALAVLASMALQPLMTLARCPDRKTNGWRVAGRQLSRIGLTGGAALVLMTVLGWPFVRRLLSTDFLALYASYRTPVPIVIGYYAHFYGWAILGLACLGFAAAILRGRMEGRAAVLVLAVLAVSVLCWTTTVGQLGLQYTLHFTPWIVLGLVGLASAIETIPSRMIRGAAIVLFLIFMVSNHLRSLPIPALPLSSTAGAELAGPPIHPRLFSARYPPPRRSDIKELVRMIAYLHGVATPDDPIYVAASSRVLNDDVLWHATRLLYEDPTARPFELFWRTTTLNIQHWVPFADSRDPYPLEKLMQAAFVVVGLPFQHHLDPNEQEVVRVVVDAFLERWEIAEDFALLREEFHLDRGVRAKIYRRVRPTSPQVALRTLRTMRQRMDAEPGGQPDWMLISQVPGYVAKIGGDRSYDFGWHSGGRLAPEDVRLLFLPSTMGNVKVEGAAYREDGYCQGLKLTLASISRDGASVRYGVHTHAHSPWQPFALQAEVSPSEHLMLVAQDLKGESVACRTWFWLMNLRVTGGTR